MVTFTIRGVHLAIAGAFLAGILIATGVVLGFGASDEGPPEEPPQVSAANLDVAPTSAPTTAPSPTPTAAPTQEPPAAPQVRSCAEIRAAGTYNSDEERTFFLANCTTQPAAAAGPTTPTSPSAGSSSTATAAEQNYRTKAEASITVMASRVGQYFDTLGNMPPASQFYEFGALLRVFAAELDRLPAPPPRFAAVHNALRTQLLRLADHIITIEASLTSQATFNVWIKAYVDIGNAMQGALEDYALVVGVDLPPIFTE